MNIIEENPFFCNVKINQKKKIINNKKIQCVAINKNKMQCKCLAKNTIYCGKHISLAMTQIILIQSWWKKYLPTLIRKRRGIGYFDKSICNNEDDFFTLCPITEISDIFFLTYYEKESKKVWGFDIRSLYHLFKNKTFENPYTTYKFDKKFISNVNFFIEKYKNHIEFNPKENNLNKEQVILRELIDMFIEINSMGYYCNHEWLINMPRVKLIKLYFEFKDIIYYRANLTDYNIMQIFGIPNPFVHDIGLNFEFKSIYDLLDLINHKLKMIMKTNMNNKDLGILLFLTALTTASPEAAICLEYLQQGNYY